MERSADQIAAGRVWSPWLARWAARDLLRQPAFALMLFVALAATTALTALALLLEQTLSTTCIHLLAQAPHLVVRRVGAGGWLPLPAEEAVARAKTIAGALRPRTRVWGVVQGPGAPVTLIGVDGGTAGLPSGWPRPLRGQAIVGPGVGRKGDPRDRVVIDGAVSRVLEVIERLPQSGGMAVHDVVLVHIDDARPLLGLASGQASDLIIDVFHEDEARALAGELATAFEWPVQVTTRQEQLGRHLAHISRATGIACLALAPLALALITLVLAVGTWGRRAWETGLLKAVGWTGADILRLHIYRGLLVGLPAVASGLAVAYALLFAPGIRWVAHLLAGWSGPLPAYYLSPAGTAVAWFLALLMTGVPFLATVFWTGWRAATADPAESLEGRC